MQTKMPVIETVARQIQDMIRDGALRPGDRIPSQRVLSERLKVSRPSLREALLTLETLGLLRTYPARGTFVVDRDAEPAAPGAWRYGDDFDIADVFRTRLVIEPELCRVAAGVITDAQLAELEAANARFDRAWRDADLVTHVEADLAFHRVVVDASPNRLLRRLYYSVHDLLTESQRQPIPNTAQDRMAQSIEEHAAIVAALRARDADRAAMRMRVHIGNTALCAGIR
ncbi:FadR family transcriptional regulator [Palleronia sediminis]|uniref:FadR family transcriptional regulator n=1 Tax=Palleronia sediminis TaxID=2547833 RepID=A0A4R6ABM2_9RHOB|nr:FCD domain-containing protein [Palleronia sediminis]TDL81361.1 FadR family transcriptional regulator [Palleronia sediminis]